MRDGSERTETIDAAQAGARLDQALHALAAGALSRRDARLLCDYGAVAVGGVRSGSSTRVREGDRVQWRPATAAMTRRLGLSVAFEGEDALVVEKPAGLAAHGGPLVHDSVAARLQSLPGSGLAHRLDRGASGLLLVGLTAAALRSFALAMSNGTIDREYRAIADGVIEGGLGEDRLIDLPLLATDEPRGDRPKVVVDPKDGQPSRTRIAVLAHGRDMTLLRVVLETGRTHQIRAHLAAIGHPLLGDARYGDPVANERARATYGVARPMLHAHRLFFRLPQSESAAEVVAFAERDFVRMFPDAVSLREPPA